MKKAIITKTLCINTLFRKNYYGQNSTDFIIDLPETLKNVTSLTLTNTDIVMNNTFWIGVYPGLTNEMLDFMVNQIETFFGISF